jgi:cell division protein FtsW
MTAVEQSKSTTDEQPERKPRKARERAGRVWAARTALTAWLGRPLASFHLLLAICALLIVIGLVMVLSASANVSLNQGGSAYAVFGKQVVFVLVGLCCSGSACACR